MRRERLLSHEAGTAAVELVLVLPLLLLLMFAGLEGGHFVWTQHKLAVAVRDGARFAARAPIDGLCDGATVVLASDTEDRIKLLTRTGQISDPDAAPVVPGWADDEVNVSVNCEAFVDTGVYSDLDAAGPVVSVAAVAVPYPSVLGMLGLIDPTVSLTAQSHAAGIGL